MSGVAVELTKPEPSQHFVRSEFEEADPVEDFVLTHRLVALDEEGSDSEMDPRNPKKKVEKLPPIDHANMNYEDIDKNFYDESEQVAALTENEVITIRRELGL